MRIKRYRVSKHDREVANVILAVPWIIFIGIGLALVFKGG